MVFGGKVGKVEAFSGKFKVSLPEKLSQVTYFRTPVFSNVPKPRFGQTSEYFFKDLKRIPVEANSPQELKWAAKQMADHYVWPVSSVEILLKANGSDRFEAIGSPVDSLMDQHPNPISASDIGIGKENGVAEMILRTGRAAYIPDTSFKSIGEVVLFPPNAVDQIIANKSFEGEKVSASKEGWDTANFAKAVNSHTRSMLLMPLKTDEGTIGLFLLGNKQVYLFGDSLLFPFDALLPEVLIGDAVRQALMNRDFPAKHA